MPKKRKKLPVRIPRFVPRKVKSISWRQYIARGVVLIPFVKALPVSLREQHIREQANGKAYVNLHKTARYVARRRHTSQFGRMSSALISAADHFTSSNYKRHSFEKAAADLVPLGVKPFDAWRFNYCVPPFFSYRLPASMGGRPHLCHYRFCPYCHARATYVPFLRLAGAFFYRGWPQGLIIQRRWLMPYRSPVLEMLGQNPYGPGVLPANPTAKDLRQLAEAYYKNVARTKRREKRKVPSPANAMVLNFRPVGKDLERPITICTQLLVFWGKRATWDLAPMKDEVSRTIITDELDIANAVRKAFTFPSHFLLQHWAANTYVVNTLLRRQPRYFYTGRPFQNQTKEGLNGIQLRSPAELFEKRKAQELADPAAAGGAAGGLHLDEHDLSGNHAGGLL